mmetsp:Transcript_47211/g.106177  ORF Transcript_47211/g.106177 Transcript_47211/m.106177 type:complete len:238 (+) Transcript_47211:728-1441(+)
MERRDGVRVGLVLLGEVLLGVQPLLDGVLSCVNVLLAKLPLLILLLLLLLELRHHLVHGCLDLGEGVQPHAHREGRQCPAAVATSHLRKALHGALHRRLPGRRPARGDRPVRGARLHKAHGLVVELAGLVLVEDPQRLAQGPELLVPHAEAVSVLLVLSLAVLLERPQKGLVRCHGLLCGLLVLLRLGGRVQHVRERGLLPLLQLCRLHDLGELRGAQALEVHLGHKVRLLGITEVP